MRAVAKRHGRWHDGRSSVRDLLRRESAAHAVRVRLSRRRGTSTCWLPCPSGGVAGSATRKRCMAAVPNVHARLHGAYAEWARGGMVLKGVDSIGGQCREALSRGQFGTSNLASSACSRPQCRAPHAACHMSQAVSLSQQGKYAEAERIERKLCDILTRKLGAEHPNTLATAANLADSLTGQGRYSAAERINRKVLAIEKRVLPHSP